MSGARPPGRRRALALLAALPACGYAPLRDVVHGARPLSVRAGTSAVAQPFVLDEVAHGARSRLAREGQLASGGAGAAGARLVVDVVALDERSGGVAAGATGPVARGAALALTGRARVDEADGATTFDSGLVQVALDASTEADAASDARRRDDTLRALGRKLGETLASRALGTPALQSERL